jgi:hypothetical protein
MDFLFSPGLGLYGYCMKIPAVLLQHGLLLYKYRAYYKALGSIIFNLLCYILYDNLCPLYGWVNRINKKKCRGGTKVFPF